MADKVAEVQIDGYNIAVRRNRADPDIWEAYHLDAPSMIFGDARAYPRNIRAIEQVSGCSVDVLSIDNIALALGTVVALDC